MPLILILAFVIIIETTFLKKLAVYTNGHIVLILIIGTALFGISIIKKHRSLRHSLKGNISPLIKISDVIMFTLAGILLIIPGIITDFLGFLCLSHKVRCHMRERITNKIIQKGYFKYFRGNPQATYTSTRQRDNETVIDVKHEIHKEPKS